ncbi:SDR family NAD(P)-dependent oxidoreductase [Nocardiopsis dassonvillei]|uniref:type I polyketide synthase n=1 Tax=Nocardiopsis dassonvillei TaxID=2014 RepID=UPI0036FC75B9
MTSVAIVGMACHYGGASTPAELWENSVSGRRAFRRIPSERLSLDDYLDPSGTDPDRVPVTHASVLQDYAFDRAAFGVAGSTYRATDLTHWLALDTAARALADAGLPDGADPSTTAVFVGNTLTGEFTRAHVLRTRWPYVRRVVSRLMADRGISDDGLMEELRRSFTAPFPEPDGDTLAGGLSNTIAGRVCSHFGFGGGGYTVDGACASSLLAVIQGCREIAEGRASAVVAGGVDLSIDPFELVGFARAGALADDDMRVFDRRSAGFLPGEGCGMLVMTSLDEARARGLRPYAVLRGWGVSSDGSGGITRPESEGQRLALERAYRTAGFAADTVSYFEAHGTGTPVGDRAELEALSGAVGGGRRHRPAVGSVKALIGHTKAAAGAAGLIRAVMAVHAQVLPPTTGCDDPVDQLSGPGARLRALRGPEPWPQDRPLRAGVSSMGFGGINAHVVVEGMDSHRRTRLDRRTETLAAAPQDAELLVFAGESARDLGDRIEEAARAADALSFAQQADLAAALARDPGSGPHRAAVVTPAGAGLAGALRRAAEAVAAGRALSGPEVFTAPPAGRRPRIGLLLSGQASAASPTGGALARRIPEAGRPYELTALPPGDPETDTSVAQPRIVAASLASIAALEALGIEADFAVGHSLGELTALHWAGVYSEADLVSLACERGRAMAWLPGEHGSMAAVAMPADRLAPLLPEGCGIACLNTPDSTVVSGTDAAVDRVVRDLGAHRLRVAHAFHSPLVAPAAPALRGALEAMEVRPPRRTVFSTVTGAALEAGTDLRDHLVRQVTEPVRFAPALEAAGPADLWIEAGPDAVLAQLASAQGRTAFAVEAGTDRLAGLLRCAGAAWILGLDVRLGALYEHRHVRALDPGRRPVFLANPCEEAAPAAESEPVRERSAPRSAAGPDPAPAAAGEDPVDTVRAVVAARVELPLSSVTERTRLREDLHLNSITVAQLIAEAAQRLSLPVPAHLTEYSGADVAQIAQILANAGSGEDAPSRDTVAGVEPWARVFTVEDVEAPAEASRPSARTAGRAAVVAAPGDPLAAALADLELGEDTLLLLPADGGDPVDGLGLLTEAASALSSAGRLVVVQGGGGPAHATAAGFARTVHQELGVSTAVVTVPERTADAAPLVAAETERLAARGGHTECRYRADGSRCEPRLRHLPMPERPPAEASLGPEDVLLVTGGGRGIGAECARDLALRSGAGVALLGRSDPGADPGLAATLKRFTDDGVRFAYLRADVTDAASVKAAVDAATAELGPVTAVLHAAGVNDPALLSDLDRAGYERAVAPKVTGARNVAAALDPGPLRLFVSFGSIIARIGLPGEAHYALANEWLGAVTEEIGARVPGCRTLAVDWSVWSGAGMGERLGSLDSLVRRGVDPIPLDTGLDLLHRLVSAPDIQGPVVVTGRYGDAPTLLAEEAELPLLRFLESPRRVVPGVEVVADVRLSSITDRYLEHHEFEGDRLLPAVMGMEAMAQAASVLSGASGPPVLTDLRFSAPVVVPADGEVTLRVAALAMPDGTVRTVLRSDATGFAVDHFSAVCAPKDGVRPGRRIELDTLPDDAPPVPVRPDEHLYGRLLFQDGPLRRTRAYRRLTGFDCVADLAGDGSHPWFGLHLPQRLLLPDPGRRDAALHALQACLPGTRLLPVGAERVTVLGEDIADAVLHARERCVEGDEHVFDLEVVDGRGGLQEIWEGLRLRVMGPGPLPIGGELLGPHLERHLRAGTGIDDLRVAVESGDTPIRRRARAVHRMRGTGVTVRGRADGRPELTSGGQVSVTHCGPLTLVATADVPIGVDLVRVSEVPEGLDGGTGWEDVLGEEGRALVAVLAERSPGTEHTRLAATAWAAAEAVRKCSGRPAVPLVLEGIEGPWTLLASGDVRVRAHDDGEYVAALAHRGGSDA